MTSVLQSVSTSTTGRAGAPAGSARRPGVVPVPVADGASYRTIGSLRALALAAGGALATTVLVWLVI